MYNHVYYILINVLYLFQNDNRKYIALSTFGFYKGGILDVKLINFYASPFSENDVVSKKRFYDILLRLSKKAL